MSRAEVRSLQVSRPDGAEIAAEVIGAVGHPFVLLVAGAECSMDWWRPEFCELIADRGRCVLRYDQRGMGRRCSGRPARAATGCRSRSATRSRSSMPSARRRALGRLLGGRMGRATRRARPP